MPDASADAIYLNDIHSRRTAIINDTLGVIVIEPNPDAVDYANTWYTIASREEVTVNAATIEAEAKKNSLEADFVKAIVWLETTHGYYDAIIPRNKTIRPMNIHADLWKGLGVTREKLNDPKQNVQFGTLILGRIWARTKNADVEKVATLYNALGAKKVTEYGKTVAKYLDDKPWVKK